MNYKKIANENYEEVSRATTRSTSRHGLSDGMAREKRIRNRAAKREEARHHIASQLDETDVPPLPDDYEECGDCGYDHAYEHEEAFLAHSASLH